jgi:hypothetical protein
VGPRYHVGRQEDKCPKTNLIFIGIKGTVVALDCPTGSEVWRSELKGKDFVNVVLQGGDLYATTKGEIFRLDPAQREQQKQKETTACR